VSWASPIYTKPCPSQAKPSPPQRNQTILDLSVYKDTGPLRLVITIHGDSPIYSEKDWILGACQLDLTGDLIQPDTVAAGEEYRLSVEGDGYVTWLKVLVAYRNFREVPRPSDGDVAEMSNPSIGAEQPMLSEPEAEKTPAEAGTGGPDEGPAGEEKAESEEQEPQGTKFKDVEFLISATTISPRILESNIIRIYPGDIAKQIESHVKDIISPHSVKSNLDLVFENQWGDTIVPNYENFHHGERARVWLVKASNPERRIFSW